MPVVHGPAQLALDLRMLKHWLRSLSIFPVLVGATFVVQASPSPSDSAVLLKPVVGKTQGAGGKTVAFFSSELVTVLSTKGPAALVRGGDGQREAWLPRHVLSDTSAFRAVNAWEGERRFEVVSASADSGQIYYFKPDGTFRAEFDDNHAPRKWTGRLYRKGQILWAKPDRDPRGFAAWSVFRQTDGGSMCMLNFDTSEGCECAGSYDSGFTAACK